MDKKKFCKHFMLWTAIIAVVVFLIFHLVFFKVVEATVFEEVAKRVVVSAGVIGILEVFSYVLAPFVWHMLYDGKGMDMD